MSTSEATEKAAACDLSYGAQQQVPNHIPGYAPPLQGGGAEQVIDYLLVHYGHAVEQNNHMRGRVWALENVNASHLQRRQEAYNVLGELRKQVAELERQLRVERAERISVDMVYSAMQKTNLTLTEHCKLLEAQVACLSPTVTGVYTYRGKMQERELHVLAVHSANGKTIIQLDLRKHGRE